MDNEVLRTIGQDLTAASFPEQLTRKNKQIDDMKATLGKLSKPSLHTVEHIVRHLKT